MLPRFRYSKAVSSVARVILRRPFLVAQKVLARAGFRFERAFNPDGTARSIYDALSPAPIRTIFDVGANVGAMSLKFASSFPEAEIFSFEPVQATFEVLYRRMTSAHIHPIRAAVGRRSGTAKIEIIAPCAQRNRIRERCDGASETVPMTTIDDFCREHSIGSIDILKSDTEGHEIEVLSGADRMLGSTRFVLVEFGLSCLADEQHAPFEAIHDVLSSRGFRLASIYELRHRKHDQRFVFGNALYMNSHETTSFGSM